MTAKAYQNLSKVVSDAHVDGFYYCPRTDLEDDGNILKGLTALLVVCKGGFLSRFFVVKKMRRKRPWVR